MFTRYAIARPSSCLDYTEIRRRLNMFTPRARHYRFASRYYLRVTLRPLSATIFFMPLLLTIYRGAYDMLIADDEPDIFCYHFFHVTIIRRVIDIIIT